MNVNRIIVPAATLAVLLMGTAFESVPAQAVTGGVTQDLPHAAADGAAQPDDDWPWGNPAAW